MPLVEFGEWLCQEVVKAVPQKHVVLSIPKILRRYFLYDRKLLSDLTRCSWRALKSFFNTITRDQKAAYNEKSNVEKMLQRLTD